MNAPARPPIETPLNWHRPGPEDIKRARQIAAAKITAVFDDPAFHLAPFANCSRETALLLALGAECPFVSQRERRIWCEETLRIGEERGWWWSEKARENAREGVE